MTAAILLKNVRPFALSTPLHLGGAIMNTVSNGFIALEIRVQAVVSLGTILPYG
jgi:hypothetical protein